MFYCALFYDVMTCLCDAWFCVLPFLIKIHEGQIYQVYRILGILGFWKVKKGVKKGRKKKVKMNTEVKKGRKKKVKMNTEVKKGVKKKVNMNTEVKKG